MKSFNTSVICRADKHYMVDMSGRVDRIIRELIRNDKYFTINRARQYGKTTILSLLRQALKPEFYVLAISFAGRSAMFETEASFVRGLLRKMKAAMENEGMDPELIARLTTPVDQEDALGDLDERITELCRKSDKEIILTVDEVDQSTNNQVLVDFLALLRDKYIRRESGDDATFKSVILAGVYDVRNLQIKIRPQEEHRYNSPWNVAVDFNIDMSFQTDEIASMLEEYRTDHGLKFDTGWFAGQIYEYTSGYPFMVSRICEILDTIVPREKEIASLEASWTKEGLLRAVKILTEETNTLLDDLNKKMSDHAKLRKLLYRIIVERQAVQFTYDDETIRLGVSFGWLKNRDGQAVVSNRIFETRIYNKFIAEKSDDSFYQTASMEMQQLKTGTELDMDTILRRFAAHYASVFSGRTADFLEKEATLLFLTFLKPIINGNGNYYIEAELADRKRTDIIVDFCGKQYIIETKIWRGKKYQEDGRTQLAGYLERYGQMKGWLLTFCFNQTKEKLVGTQDLVCEGKLIREVVV